MTILAFDEDDVVVLMLALAAAVTLVAGVRNFRRIPRRPIVAAALVTLALLLGWAAYFRATFQIPLF